MVEHLDVDQGEGGLERARKDFVGVARLRYTRGVVVSKDDGGSVYPQCGLYDFAGINARLRERPAE